MANYINTIVTSNETTNETTEYQIQSFDTLDKNNIIDAAYKKVVNEALPNLQDASNDLDVPDYLDKNTKEASFTIGNNHTSLKKLQTQIDTAYSMIDVCTLQLDAVISTVNDIKTPIDECPTTGTLFTINDGTEGIESNIESITLTKSQEIPNRKYGTQSINKITCGIKVNGELFDDDTKKEYKDGVEIQISLPPVGDNQALLPLQLGGIWQSSNNSGAQSFDPFPMFTRKGELMAICFQQGNQLIIKVFQIGMTYPCNRLFFSLEYVLFNANQTEGDETTQ